MTGNTSADPQDPTAAEFPSRFIVVEGIDGAGKSSVCRLVGQLGHAQHLTNKTRCEQPAFAVDAMNRLADLIWPRTDTDFDHLFPAGYWLHLQAAWYQLLGSQVVRPRLRSEGSIIMDGWFFKLVAKLRLRDFELPDLMAAFAGVIEPDLVVLLQPDPESVWDRGREHRLTEMGLHHPDEYPVLGRESFIDYQGRIGAELRKLAEVKGWQVLPVPAGETVERTALRVAELVFGEP